jgi:hypothetical protein
MSDLTAMVLMVIVTSIALSIIWGTYFRQRPIWREPSALAGSPPSRAIPSAAPHRVNALL